MLILGQKYCFLGPTIFKIPQPNWYYCPYGQKLKIHFGNLSQEPSVLSTLCLLPIWDYCFVLKFPCRLIYLWTFFFCCTLIRDSHLFGAQEYLVRKRRSNLAQFWFSKSNLSDFFSLKSFEMGEQIYFCHFW